MMRIAGLIFALSCLIQPPVSANQKSAPKAKQHSSAPAPSSVADSFPNTEAAPAWSEISSKQQAALAPLQPHWQKMTATQKYKWLAVSRNYHKLTDLEQQTMHARMNAWAALDPRARAQARFEYSRAQTLSVDERKARWQAYQELSKATREQLAQRPPFKAKGVAIALRPGPATKTPQTLPSLAIPSDRPARSQHFDPASIRPRTLLPLKKPDPARP